MNSIKNLSLPVKKIFIFLIKLKREQIWNHSFSFFTNLRPACLHFPLFVFNLNKSIVNSILKYTSSKCNNNIEKKMFVCKLFNEFRLKFSLPFIMQNTKIKWNFKNAVCTIVDFVKLLIDDYIRFVKS